MAISIFIPDYQRKAYNVLGLGICFMVLMTTKGYARDFSVNWGLHNADSYNQWAEKNRFQIDDSLVFIYTPKDDSVLHVNEEAYKNCCVESPLSSYTDGHTVFSLSHSGPYYFISGNKGNCEKNEKLVVVVLADRSNCSSTTNGTAPPPPAPSSSIDIIPPLAPSSPAASPPPETAETNPTPAPSGECPLNAASSVFMSVTGSMGAIFVASTLFLAF
ncbi:early nodulin-like protein 3 isoform X2 [Hibiscus syriacus]|uniref:early nodulin-like protein 3 isoform X2 n=1 Tax=Hibiscus syriacus TaxID=106335 RepID=UPI00192138CC|nr:early nodulin-like protein 3 isoform X2 [Hibiscus syriacus]